MRSTVIATLHKTAPRIADVRINSANSLYVTGNLKIFFEKNEAAKLVGQNRTS